MTSFLVAGAGIAGLVTAAGLQQQGHDVLVLEERAETTTGAAISLWPNALAALDHVGLGGAVRAVSTPVAAGVVRRRDGRVLRRVGEQAMLRALGEPVRVVRRARLVETLAAQLAPGTVRWGAAVRDVRCGAGVSVGIAEARHEAAALIGADGTRSVVARYLNGPLPDRYAGYPVWLGVAETGIADDDAGLTLGDGVEAGHLGLDAGHTYWFAALRAAEGTVPGPPARQVLAAAVAAWAGPVPRLVAATPPDQLLCLDLYDRARARSWHRGPVVAIGDAAHPMRPHLGQGGAQAIEDAVTLVSLLERHNPAEAFARHASLRRPRVEQVVRLSRWIGRAVTRLPEPVMVASSRCASLAPDTVALRGLALVAGRTAFVPPP